MQLEVLIDICNVEVEIEVEVEVEVSKCDNGAYNNGICILLGEAYRRHGRSRKIWGRAE